jgi:hypothetical protein
VRYYGLHVVKPRRRSGTLRRQGTVTHERQRDSDGLAAISGQIAATVAQAQRRKKPTTGLNAHKRVETSQVIGFTE